MSESANAVYHVGPMGGLVPGPLLPASVPSMMDAAQETKWVPNEHNNQRHAKAYMAGKLAYQQGYAAGSNPHATVTHEIIMAMGWMAGWMDGMNEAINAVTVPSAPGRRAIRVA